MPVAVTQPPTVAANDATVGTQDWLTPANALASDNAYARVNAQGTTHYLKVTGFGFAIPAGAEILGIQVNVERNGSANVSKRDSSLRLVKGGVISGDDKADTSVALSWPSADAVASYGSASDLWGQAWTPADINDASFGVVLAALLQYTVTGNVQVDQITVTVTYALYVGKSVAFPSTLTTLIGKSCGLPYAVSAFLAKSCTLPYVLATVLGKSCALSWAVIARIGKSLALRWSITGITALSLLNADTYSDGASNPFGSATESVYDLTLFATYITEPVLPEADDFYYARLPFDLAQSALDTGKAVGEPVRIGRLGWHGTRIDPERGSFAVVDADGPLADLVGERVRITSGRGEIQRSVIAYCHNRATLGEDMSVTRRLFLALAVPGDDSLSVEVEIIG